jgi:hypothetical protein
MAEQKQLAVTDIRISFISGNDKHVAVDISKVQDVLAKAGKGATALAFGELAEIGAKLLNGHDDATKISATVDDKGELAIVPASEPLFA